MSEQDHRAGSAPHSLKSLTVLLDATPDAVCQVLLRNAATAAAPQGMPGQSGRLAVARWSAHRPEGGNSVTYTLHDGPFSSLQIRFSAEADGIGSSVLWITCEYGLKSALLRGTLERWQAQRDATTLRDGLVESLKSALLGTAGQSKGETRSSERVQVRAPARLRAAGREWRAEVLDVSETGLALVIATPPGQAEAEAKLLLAQPYGEVILQHLGEHTSAGVTVRRAVPGRGGLQVGLQADQPEAILPLVRRALSRVRPCAPEK